VTIFHQQTCPLCDNTAEYGEVDAGNVKYFECPYCGMFQITIGAEKRLIEELPDRKATYSAQVKETPEEHLFFIRLPIREFRESSDDRLQAEFTPKSELSLTCR
jgi:hypothetical protein